MDFTTSLNRAKENIIVTEDGILQMTASAQTDFFSSPDGNSYVANAPVLLKEVDNLQPFTFAARLTPEFMNIYDAGALFVYVDTELWQKFAFEMDEQKNTRIVSVRTIGTSDDNNHSIIIEESVYLKISSDGHQIGFYYSTDNEIWNMARLYRNVYPPTICVGISSQSPRGEGNRTVFSEISLSDTSVKDFRMGV